MGLFEAARAEVRLACDLIEAAKDACISVRKSSATSSYRLSYMASAPAAIGAALGGLSTLLCRNSRSTRAVLGGALIGGALGYAGGSVWASREWVEAAAQNTARRVHQVHDAYWLEKHPITYA